MASRDQHIRLFVVPLKMAIWLKVSFDPVFFPQPEKKKNYDFLGTTLVLHLKNVLFSSAASPTLPDSRQGWQFALLWLMSSTEPVAFH